MMRQLTGNDYDFITSHFGTKTKKTTSTYKSPYLNNQEFSDFNIRDNLFNYKCLYYGNDENADFACFRMRKKPLNSLVSDLVYFTGETNKDYYMDMNTIFEGIANEYKNVKKICLYCNQADVYNNNILSEFINTLHFKLEVTFLDEFGVGNHVLLFSRFL